VGFREITTFGAGFILWEPVANVRPLEIFQMLEEASTGFAGATGRQVTLDAATTGAGQLAATEALVAQLELADERGLVNLRAVGTIAGAGSLLSYRGGGVYRGGRTSLTHSALIAGAQAGTTIMTLTAHLSRHFGKVDFPQPLLGLPAGTGPTGDPALPMLGGLDPAPFMALGTDVRSDARVWLDGQPATATLTCTGGATGVFCNNGAISIDLASSQADGLHLLQVQNGRSFLSNELPVCFGTANACD
jgi:hypothetical protein